MSPTLVTSTRYFLCCICIFIMLYISSTHVVSVIANNNNVPYIHVAHEHKLVRSKPTYLRVSWEGRKAFEKAVHLSWQK